MFFGGPKAIVRLSCFCCGLAFYFELEAGALNHLSNDMCFADLATLLSPGDNLTGENSPAVETPSIMALEGDLRIKAFKLLLSSVWMLIVLLEAQQKNSSTACLAFTGTNGVRFD